MLARMEPRRYRITVGGSLGASFTEAFERALLESNGRETHLWTEAIDQAQLRGLIELVLDLGLDLRQVQELEP